eukprot:Em0011g1010a
MMHRNDPEIERLIVRYWRQHKTVAVILAYLRLAHRVSVRKIIWLELSTTNNDPGCSSSYYLTAVFQLGGSGTFGVVVKGVYLGTEVAIKMIKMDDDMNLKTHLEVQIMSSNKSELLIVMNLVNGFNVDQVIFKQALPNSLHPAESGVQWMVSKSLLKSMAFAHIPQRVLGQQPQENLATVVHWFRIDSLRLHDNPAFNYAVTSGLRFKAIFIVDPWFNASYNNGPSVNVWRFYLESLHDLNDKLQKRPYQTRLNVFVGQPTAILPALFSRWNVSKLTFQASQVSYESKQHDEIIQRMATEHSVECVSFFAHTLYNPNDILTCNNGRVPVSYKEFRRLLPIVGCPQEPIPEPNPLSLLLSYVAPGTSIAEGEIPTLQSLGFAPNEKLYTTTTGLGERLKH